VRTYLTAPRAYQLPVLVGSMMKHCQPFTLHVLAWDFDGFEVPSVKALGWNWHPETSIRFTHRSDFLALHPEYENLPGPPRKTINHIDTARWRVIADLISEGFGPVTYLDGDQFFFSSPEPMYAEIGDAKLAVSPHRIPPRTMGLPGVVLETHRKYGLFNSGLSVVADLAIAEEMAEAVFRWSYCATIEYPPGNYLFGDQGHLERVACKHGAHVIQNPGVNVAPWNANRHRLEEREGELFVDDVPLVTYHFSGLRPGGQLAHPEYCVPQTYLDLVYRPYLAELERTHA
jgi:hypothetical protein